MGSACSEQVKPHYRDFTVRLETFPRGLVAVVTIITLARSLISAALEPSGSVMEARSRYDRPGKLRSLLPTAHFFSNAFSTHCVSRSADGLLKTEKPQRCEHCGYGDNSRCRFCVLTLRMIE